MAPTRGAGHEEEEQICPLCINELDETEKAWLPCSCGYQLCLFCYDRLKTEFSNRCPNCRVEYDSDFQAGLRRRQERAAQLQKEAAAAREAAAKAAAAAAAAAKQQVQPPPPPPPRAARSPRSPRRDLHIEQEQLWPSLGAAAAQQQQQHHHQHHHGAAHHSTHQQQHAAAQQRQQQQQQQAAEGGRRRQNSPPQPPLQPRLAPILPAPPPQPHPVAAEAEASSSSSADTAATTPQSPASSVVCFRAAQVQPGLLGCSGRSKPPAVPALPAAPGLATVQGQCAVVLQRNGCGLGVEPDPEGASLAASLQEAVRAGSLSVKQAAASLASYLRQRQQAAAAAAVAASSASSSPARGGRQPSSAGSSGSTPAGRSLGLTPFSMPPSTLAAAAAAAAAAGCSGGCSTSALSSESSLLAACDSMVSVATSVSFSHWAPGSTSPSSSLPLSVAQPLGGMGSWQQQQQQQQQQLVGSPVRDNHKLPLFMRRGTLPPGAALAGCGSGGGSPSSADSHGSSSAGSGSFPGFPSRSSSPTSELRRMIAPPPGFGPPLGSTGIAALPRFR